MVQAVARVKRRIAVALKPEMHELLSHAAEERGISRAEFIRQQLELVLEQYRKHPKPRVAGVVRRLSQRGDESELFGASR